MQISKAGKWFVSFAAVMSALLFAAAPGLANAEQQAAATTQLKVSSENSSRGTRAMFDVTVAGNAGTPQGIVTLVLNGKEFGSALLDDSGHVRIPVDSFAAGYTTAVALYKGSDTYAASTSMATQVHASSAGTADYTLAITPSSQSVVAGNYVTATVTVSPVNSFAQSISFTCANLPDSTTCTFLPSMLTLSTTSGSQTSVVTFQTSAAAGTARLNNKHTLALAILLPGFFLFAGFVPARRRWAGTFRLLAMVSLLGISMAGLTACSQRYGYFHNPPAADVGTPAAINTVLITAYAFDGVTSYSHCTTETLTVTTAATPKPTKTNSASCPTSN